MKLHYILLCVLPLVVNAQPVKAQDAAICANIELNWVQQPVTNNRYTMHAAAEIPGGRIDFQGNDDVAEIQISMSTHWCSTAMVKGETGALWCSAGQSVWYTAIKPWGKNTNLQLCKSPTTPAPSQPSQENPPANPFTRPKGKVKA